MSRARALEQDEDLAAVLSTEQGRRFLSRLIFEGAGVEKRSYAAESTHATAYHEGRRSLGLDLLEECLRVSPTDYIHMRAEAVSRQHEDALFASAESTRD